MQLALFEPLDLKNVGPRGGFQRPDRGIEVAVFLQHARKLSPEFPFFLRCHLALRFHRPQPPWWRPKTPISIAR